MEEGGAVLSVYASRVGRDYGVIQYEWSYKISGSV